MRRAVLLLLAVLLPLAPISATDWFDAYTTGDSSAARAALEQELTARPFDPLLHYNLGVIAEKEERRGEALYHYLQALQAAPDFAEARNNLDLLAEDLHVTIPSHLLEKGGDLSLVMILFFIALYLFVFVLIWHLVRPDWRRRLALVPLFMFLLLAAFLFADRYREHARQRYAVVVTAQTLRGGPDEALSAVGAVHEGEVTALIGASGGWAKVRSLQDNVEGWVAASQIRYVTRRAE